MFSRCFELSRGRRGSPTACGSWLAGVPLGPQGGLAVGVQLWQASVAGAPDLVVSGGRVGADVTLPLNTGDEHASSSGATLLRAAPAHRAQRRTNGQFSWSPLGRSCDRAIFYMPRVRGLRAWSMARGHR